MSGGRGVPIRYREVWDVPRIFFVHHGSRLLLFDCPFDETIEDYPNLYHVYLMPLLNEQELAGSWGHLAGRAIEHLADVPISHVHFDPSKRESVDADLLDELIARKAAG
jgi:hypothetical protein